ncbi:MAG: ABC transporter ATP-binding protein [Planctomycetota bacterium]
MAHEPAIVVENLSKMYHKRAGTGTLLSMIPGLRPRTSDEFWALRDVSFEVSRGECLGIIGPNGAGKSTLLKILSKITSPTSGSYRVNGRLSSLIEVGAGFHPELTGRENVYLNAAILGMDKSEIESKFDQIVDFAELWGFIDVPVKRYSSGMRVRLGFSVAAHVDPEILLIDEVLAVGDLQFRIRSYNKIARMLSECAVVFISHSMPHVTRLCSRAIVLREGEMIHCGSVGRAVELYQSNIELPQGITAGTGEVRLTDLALFARGESRTVFEHGDTLTIRLAGEAERAVRSFHIIVQFFGPNGRVAVECNSFDTGPIENPAGPFRLTIEVGELYLKPGVYTVTLIFLDGERSYKHLLVRHMAEKFTVEGQEKGTAFVLLPGVFRLE